VTVLLFAFGWIPVPQKRACGPMPPGYVCSTSTQVSFGYPAEWSAAAYDDGGIYSRSLLRFDAQGVAGGWYTGKPWSLRALPGRATTVGGMPAKIDVEPHGCAYLHGDELIVAWVETRRRHARYELHVCISGPDLRAREAEVAGVLASTRFPYG
jgi:hypothetical protein